MGSGLASFLRNVLIALIVATIAVPLHLVAATTGATHHNDATATAQAQLAALLKDPVFGDKMAGIEEIIAELEKADENTYPEDIPDPFHLTQQYMLVARGDGNRSDRYHLAGTEGGLPLIVPRPDAVQAVIYDGKLAFRYKHGVHVIESIEPVVMAYDDEMIITITKDGSIYAADMVFVRTELFKAPIPVHKVAVQVDSEDMRGLQLSYVTRGFSPFVYELGEEGELLAVAPTRRFTAGDVVMWRDVGEDAQRVLISVLPRDVVVDAINNGNYLLGSLAYALRKDKPAEVNAVLAAEKQQQGRSLAEGELERYRDGASAQAEQVLQSMKVQRLQKMIADDVRRNSYRDEFTYATWQRDYLIIRDQAKAVAEKLEGKFFRDATDKKKLNDLRQQLRRGDFTSSWIMLSKLYLKESKDMVIDRINSLKTLRTPEANAKIAQLEEILQTHDFERLWNEPELFADTDADGQPVSPLRQKINRFSYKHLDAASLRGFASTIGGLGLLGAAGVGTAWALKTGLSLSHVWPPAPFKVADLPPRPDLGQQLDNFPYDKVRKGYRGFLIRGTIAAALLVPAVALIAHFVARSSGHDWDFRRQLVMQGMRIYAMIALPIWHRLAQWTGQTTLMPSLAAGVSPFTAISGKSAIGENIGLASSEKIRVGFQAPYGQSEDGEVLRRRAIAELQQQRARAQGLGWEMAARIVLRDYLQRHGSDAEIDRDAFLAHIQHSSFKDKWKKLATGLEREVYRLHTRGIFGDLRAVTYEYVYDFLHKTQPQLLQAPHYDRGSYKLGAALDSAAESSGRFFATVATVDANYLRLADPDEFIASINWQSFWIDFGSVIFWDATYGSRTYVFHKQVLDKNHAGVGNLVASNRFPYWGAEHGNELITQVWAHQVSAHGRYSLVFQMLKRIEDDDYRPLAELFTAGDEQAQGLWEGLYDFGKNSVDFRNVDYGSKYMRQLGIMLTLMQAGLFWHLTGRPLIAGVAPKRVLPQYAFSAFFATWGFAWPWIFMYSTKQLQETKLGVRNGLFTQGKAQLKQGLLLEAQDLQEGYNNIVAVYRDFAVETPAVLLKEVRTVERDLNINDDRRLPESTLLPYMGLLVRMQNSDSVIAKRDIYRQLVELIDDPQQEYVISREDAEQLLALLYTNPPFPAHLNSTVTKLAIATVAVVTTMLGSVFIRKTYGDTRSTWKGVAPWVGYGLAIYALVWTLTSKDNARQIIDFVREDVLGYPPSRAKEY